MLSEIFQKASKTLTANKVIGFFDGFTTNQLYSKVAEKINDWRNYVQQITQ